MATVKITASGNQLDGATIDGIATDDSLKDLIVEVKTLASKMTKKASIALDPASKKSLKELADSSSDAASALDTLSKNALDLGKNMKGLSAKVEDATDSARDLARDLAKAGASAANKMTDMSDETSSLSDSFASVSGMTGGLSGSFAQAAGIMGKSGQGFAAAAGMGTKGIVGMATKANVYAAAISLAIDAMGDIVSAGAEFTKFLFTGGTRLSDFTEALHNSVSQLPVVGGALGIFTGVLGLVTKTLDSYLDSLEAVSASGASFNNNIMLMRGAAYQTGQTLEQFASTVSANTDKFAQFGTVTEGALKFAKVSETVRKDLRNLGLSAQEVNDTLPTIMSLYSQGAQGSSLTTDQMANSAKNLMSEMDAMAKLTGKSRKEQADAQAKTMQEAAVRMKMASMNKEQQDALNEAMIQARAKFGESGAEMVKLRILGIAPQTEAQRNYQAVMGGAMKGMTDYTDSIINGTGVIEDDVERKKKLDQLTADGQVKVMKVAKQFGTQLAVSSAGGANAIAGATEAIQIASQNKLNADGTLDEAELKRKTEAARTEQKNQDDTTKSLKEFDESMKKVQQSLFEDLIMPLFEHFKPNLLNFVELAKTSINGLVDSLKDPTSFINTTFVPAIKWVGEFLANNWQPILVGIGAGLAAMVVSLGIANAPILAVAAVAGLLYKGFQMLKENGWSFGLVLEAMGDGFKSVFNTLQDSVLNLVEKFGKFLGMDTSWIGEKRKQIAEEQKLLEEKSKLRDEQRQKNVAELNKTKSPPATAPATVPTSVTTTKSLTLDTNKQKNVDLLTDELKKKGFNQGQIAAVLGNVAKESGMVPQEENLNYAKTSNERIRAIFGERASTKSDTELEAIKKDPKQMGEMMYGAGTKIGRGMGNTEPGDGFKYRGRGFIQLTGKSNYAAASKAIFGDNRLVENPDLANDPTVAAQISAWFTDKQGKGMAKKMGVDLASASQEDLNRVYTSAIAGREIKKSESGYLGGEVMAKVSAYAQQFGGTSVASSPPVTTVAPSAQTLVSPPQTEQPSASPVVTQTQVASTKPSSTTGGNDVGILSALRELIELQNRSNKLLNTIAQNV